VTPRDDLNDLLRASMLAESRRWGGGVSLPTQGGAADEAPGAGAAHAGTEVAPGDGDGDGDDRSQARLVSPRAARPRRTDGT
jgi:hypothetical protein